MEKDSAEISIRQQEELTTALQEADYVLMKSYQYELSDYPVLQLSEEVKNWDVPKHTRLFKIDRIAYDKKEDNLAKLSNVYNALSAVKGSVILIIDSDGENVDFYIGTKTIEEKDIHIAFKTLEKSFMGNFPGCELKNLTRKRIEKVIDGLFEYRTESSDEEKRVISSVSGISSVRDIVGNKEKREFTQGIEKLVDSMRGEVYSVILLADAVPQKEIDTIKKGYEQLYTKLVPFASAELSLGYTEGKTLTDSVTNGVSDTISESLTLSQSHSHTTSTSLTSTNTGGVSLNGVSASHSSSKTKTEADTYTEGRAEMKGTSKTHSFSLGLSSAFSEGISQSMQIKTEEKSVIALLEKIDTQLRRLSECGDLGMWNCSAYFIADDLQISKTAASTYQALIRGENSGIEAVAINTWSADSKQITTQNYDYMSEYLRKLFHPEIFIGERLPVVNPTALISGAELTIQAGLPQKSIQGLAVAHYAAFGRDVQSQDKELGSTISLGKVFHMGVKEAADVLIDKKSLTGHTFITGSTNSGKSNTVYQMLSELRDKRVPFLVVEPAKGEYKNIFGNQEDVQVYGTNLKKTQLLRINPFKFPEDVHVLEHIDRLVEIFNVCWPMYAAMPAVLKEAVERAYIIAGWNMKESENVYSPAVYPTFTDVLNELYVVINESDFSAELKGNYAGALVTRVKSLTNGIIGQIFVSDEIDNETLFDKNVIVDLSRGLASDTKAMIMGILVLKLQEYRMSEGGMNKPLQHVTVLEEAHHLLKRTSTEQSTETSNLLGKSVEMLGQAIAEMRTYGEGFIIVDQSPNMLDMSVIRNTNTKIILRLPDITDRELCGRAANLNDEQIVELAKLPTGVAAVYQNNWIEPVLCKVNYCSVNEKEYVYVAEHKNDKEQKLTESILRCLLAHSANERIEYSLEDLEKRIIKSDFSARTKRLVIKALRKENKEISDVCEAVDSIFETSDILKKANKAKNLEQWNILLLQGLNFNFERMETVYQKLILQCILKQKSMEQLEFKETYDKWVSEMKRGVI